MILPEAEESSMWATGGRALHGYSTLQLKLEEKKVIYLACLTLSAFFIFLHGVLQRYKSLMCILTSPPNPEDSSLYW